MLAVGVGAVWGLPFWNERTHPGCTLVLVADRSSSSDNGALAAERAEEAHDVLDEYTECDQVIMSEIREFYGDAEVEIVPLKKDSSAWTDRIEHEHAALGLAHETIDNIFLSPVGKRTNMIATLDELENQVGDVAGSGRIHAFFWWDGIQSVRPLNMRKAFNGQVDVDQALAEIERVPDCSGWLIRFVGVNRTAERKLPSIVVQNAEDFWHAWVDQCGGQLRSYSPTLETKNVED